MFAPEFYDSFSLSSSSRQFFVGSIFLRRFSFRIVPIKSFIDDFNASLNQHGGKRVFDVDKINTVDFFSFSFSPFFVLRLQNQST